MNKIKKTLFTLSVDNYAPEIREVTFPFMERYANKIGAEFYVIDERKFPEAPPVYEKLQIYELGRKMQNDWNIFIDADALIHPDTPDITLHLGKDTVLHHGFDLASNRWKYNEYFLRDGRNIGSCNWFTIASDWCIDLWEPLDIPIDEAVKNIQPIQLEKNHAITPEHLIDDYALSRNIAKYGLKFKSFIQLIEELGQPNFSYFYHEYTKTVEEKVKDLKRVALEWMTEKGEKRGGA